MGGPLPRSTRLRSGGLDLHCLVWGEDGDPTAVLVHGNGGHAHWWDALVPALVPGSRLVVPDLRGTRGRRVAGVSRRRATGAMGMAEQWHFGEFRFEAASGTLWRGTELVALTPKAASVLRRLLAERGRLVTKDALLDAAWPDTAVGDSSLKACIAEIRRALGDPAEAPRFIATLHRRGYRFLPAAAGDSEPADAPRPPPLIGRAAPLAALRAALADAAGGTRRTLFVTGEPGIGKTRLLDALLDEAEAAGVAVARGRCVEHFGAAEPYLPVLDALGRLGRSPTGAALPAVLRSHAPLWLVQLPALVPEAERTTPPGGGSSERMLRELTDAVEAFTVMSPLILALEDLHWSDPSTLDVLARLAERTEPARLLVIGSYRPVDVILAEHGLRTLRARLVAQRSWHELALDFLAANDVQEYLAARLDGMPPAGLAAALHRRTDGNPLFLVSAVDGLCDDGTLAREDGGWTLRGPAAEIETRIPEGLRALLEQQVERLAEDDTVLLEAAALAGAGFSAALVAAALERDPVGVEARAEQLARAANWVRGDGVEALPDGSVSNRYRFTHALHGAVLAARVPAARAARLHLRMGEWLERAHGEQAKQLAPLLAHHFDAGGDAVRAVRYYRRAARTAAARHAHREAWAALTRALERLERLPAESRPLMRFALLAARGTSALMMGGAGDAIADFDAVAEAAVAAGMAEEEVRAQLALAMAWSLRDRGRGLACAARAAERSGDVSPALRLRARAEHAYWWARQHGWRAAEAAAATAAVDGLRGGAPAPDLALALGIDAFFRNLRGDYAVARAAAEEALALVPDGATAMLAQWQRSWALLHAGEWTVLLAALADAVHAAERDGHALWALVFEQFVAWTLAEAGLAVPARARADAAFAAAREAGHAFGIVLGAVVSGAAALRAGDAAAETAAFTAAAEVAERNPAAMEWSLRAPLHLGQSAAALMRGDADAARHEATVAAALAAQAGEPTYATLAAAAEAVAALAASDRRGADAALKVARASSTGAGPLARARVEAAAAAIGRRRAAAPDPGADLRAALGAAPPDVAAKLKLPRITPTGSVVGESG
jgi:DNA-binding winged helix-turn-helix (wHTH) protein